MQYKRAITQIILQSRQTRHAYTLSSSFLFLLSLYVFPISTSPQFPRPALQHWTLLSLISFLISKIAGAAVDYLAAAGPTCPSTLHHSASVLVYVVKYPHADCSDRATVTPYILVGKYGRFGGRLCRHFQSQFQNSCHAESFVPYF
jgi:hypothetical protein